MIYLFEILVFVYYCMSIFETRFKKWIFPVAFLMVYWIPFSFLHTDPNDAWFRIPLSMAVVFAMTCIFFKDKLSKKLIYLLIYISCSLATELLLMFVFTLLGLDAEQLKSSKVSLVLMQLYYVPLELAYSVFIIKISKRNIMQPNKKVLLNIVLFVLSQVLLYNTIAEIYYYYHINSIFMSVLFGVSLTLSLIFGILIYRSVANMFKKRQQEQSMFEQSMYQAEKYETLKTAYMDYHRLRHDFYDHISVLDSLKAAGNEEKLNNYITQMKVDFENLENVVFCDNTAVDMLVSNKARTAQEKGIRTEFSLKDTVDCDIDDMDLCSIFSNLLNNAIRGAEEFGGNKYIVMQSYIKAGCFVITCRNSSNMPDPDMKTTKNDKDKHGFGIQIIKNISKKLSGNAVFKYNNNEFVSAVTIPITSI